MRVLVVDDDRTILKLVEQFLDLSAHHHVVTAPSAIAALEEISDATDYFDCILADIQMPEVDGIALVRFIRETPGYENTPLVMLTAMHEKCYLDRAFAAGATDYITKPLDFEDLLTRLQEAQTLVEEKSRVQRKSSWTMGTTIETSERKGFQLRDPIPLQGLEGAIDFGEFQNYVRQLSRRRLFGAAIFVVEIAAIAEVFEGSTSEGFEALIRKVAVIVQKTLLDGKGVISYRGAGTFVCAPQKRLSDARGTMETTINKRFNLLHPRSGQVAVRLLVGEQILLDVGNELDVLAQMATSGGDVNLNSIAVT